MAELAALDEPGVAVRVPAAAQEAKAAEAPEVVERHTDETIVRAIIGLGRRRQQHRQRPEVAAGEVPAGPTVRAAIGAVALWPCNHLGNIGQEAGRPGWDPRSVPCPDCGQRGQVYQQAGGGGWAPVSR